ncbi:MAG TPA: methionyl-tRNA formyltransferase, partial [Solirubrobacteraceae bacterium]|nr:methionyl-tRNA formyltransferase [Solirubrobacteraceae bacterium]
PAVKQAALDAGIEVLQPQRARDASADLGALTLDACAVVAYGALLPPSVLDLGGHGFVNLHFSLLPRWRGAAPVQHALRNGDTVTGVTTFILDEGMDTGPILARVAVPIAAGEVAGELLERLAHHGAPVLADSLRALVAGDRGEPQPDEGGTYAPKLTSADLAIAWADPAARVVDLVRSASPRPGAHTSFRGRRLKVLRAQASPSSHAAGGAGTVVGDDPFGPVVVTGDGAVVLLEVQPEGRSTVSGEAFLRGYRPEVGEQFG